MRPTRAPTVEPSFAPSNVQDTPSPTYKVVAISIQLKVDHLLHEEDLHDEMRLVMRMAMADVLDLPLDSILEPVLKMVDDGVDSASPSIRRMLASRPVIEIGVIMVATPLDSTAPSADGGVSAFEKNCIETVTTDVGLAVTSGAMQQAFLQQSAILATALGESADAIVENVVFVVESPVVLNLTPTRQPTAAPATESVVKKVPVAAIIGGVVAAVAVLAGCGFAFMKSSQGVFPIADEDADDIGLAE
jgi:hypothetical protein